MLDDFQSTTIKDLKELTKFEGMINRKGNIRMLKELRELGVASVADLPKE